jgi:hypothetical protein
MEQSGNYNERNKKAMLSELHMNFDDVKEDTLLRTEAIQESQPLDGTPKP